MCSCISGKRSGKSQETSHGYCSVGGAGLYFHFKVGLICAFKVQGQRSKYPTVHFTQSQSVIIIVVTIAIAIHLYLNFILSSLLFFPISFLFSCPSFISYPSPHFYLFYSSLLLFTPLLFFILYPFLLQQNIRISKFYSWPR